MKYLIIFVSLCLCFTATSCLKNPYRYHNYAMDYRLNSLYLSKDSGMNYVRITDGTAANEYFLKNVSLKDTVLLSNIYEYYKLNNLDTADAIFYIQDRVGGKGWSW